MREEAWRLFSQHRDKNYDLIDCISFSMMASFSIRVVFGFDRHFIHYGFRLLPD
jgi:predicted nucleic acid-binding protein